MRTLVELSPAETPPPATAQFDTLPFRVPPGSRALREELGVGSYRTVLFLKDGAPVATVSGLVPSGAIGGGDAWSGRVEGRRRSRGS